MYNKDEINDSIEFVKDTRLYFDTAFDKTKQKNSYYEKNTSFNGNVYHDNLNEDKSYIKKADIDKAYKVNHDSNTYYKNNNYKKYTDLSREIESNKRNRTNTVSHGFYRLLKEMISLLLCIIIAFFIAKFITTYLGQHTKVEGYSMEKTLNNGDHLIIDKLNYRLKDPKRFDIIVFPYSEGVYYIKRIIALPGETVQIIDDRICINGEPLDEDYGKEVIEAPGLADDPIILSSDEYFVLGDNRNHSKDSRSNEVGTIIRDKIVGKAFIRIWPLKDFGILKHQ